MAEERKLSMGEVRKTIATALAAAFGFVIALIWSNVVFGGLAVAGVPTAPAGGDIVSLVYFIVTAIVLTVVMVVLIIVVSRWGSK